MSFPNKSHQIGLTGLHIGTESCKRPFQGRTGFKRNLAISPISIGRTKNTPAKLSNMYPAAYTSTAHHLPHRIICGELYLVTS